MLLPLILHYDELAPRPSRQGVDSSTLILALPVRERIGRAKYAPPRRVTRPYRADSTREHGRARSTPLIAKARRTD